jgi:transposase-like protein
MVMARRGERNYGKERYWRRLLRQWQRSGQGVRSFCLAHGLSEPSFYAWRRTLQERDRQAESRTGRSPRQAGHSLPAFVPVTLVPSTPLLEVVLRAGRVVRVPAGFDAASLRQLLVILDAEATPC